jgi:hypothetical protein
MASYRKVVDVKCEEGELKIVVELCSLTPHRMPNYEPKVLLSPQQLVKLREEYGVRWDGSETSLKEIKRKIKGRFVEL